MWRFTQFFLHFLPGFVLFLVYFFIKSFVSLSIFAYFLHHHCTWKILKINLIATSKPVNLTRQSYQKVDFRAMTSLKIRDQFYYFNCLNIRSIHTPCQSWFQRFDVRGGLLRLFHVCDGLHTQTDVCFHWVSVVRA